MVLSIKKSGMHSGEKATDMDSAQPKKKKKEGFTRKKIIVKKERTGFVPV